MKIFCLVLWVTLVSMSLGMAYAQNVSASSLLCNALSQIDKFVGAAYVPGVDVHGRHVAKADIETNYQEKPLRVVRIPLDLDIAQRLNLQLPTGVDLTPTLGFLSVSQDGTVKFEGNNMTQKAQSYCADVTKNINPAKQSLNGQWDGDRILSNSTKNAQVEGVLNDQSKERNNDE